MNTTEDEVTKLRHDEDATQVAPKAAATDQKECKEKEDNQSSKKDKKNQKLIKKIAAYTGAGVLLGSAATVFLNMEAAEPLELEEGESETPIDQNAEGEEAIGINDDMTFNEAFAAARSALGAGAVFEWRGNVYATYTKEEWDALNDGGKSEFLSTLVIEDPVEGPMEDPIDITGSGEELTEADPQLTPFAEGLSEIEEPIDDGIEVITVGGVESEVINTNGDLLFGQTDVTSGEVIETEDPYLTPIDELSGDVLTGFDNPDVDINFEPGSFEEGPDYLAEL